MDIPPPRCRAARSPPALLPQAGTFAICKAALIGPRDRINGNGTEIFGAVGSKESARSWGPGADQIAVIRASLAFAHESSAWITFIEFNE